MPLGDVRIMAFDLAARLEQTGECRNVALAACLRCAAATRQCDPRLIGIHIGQARYVLGLDE